MMMKVSGIRNNSICNNIGDWRIVSGVDDLGISVFRVNLVPAGAVLAGTVREQRQEEWQDQRM